MAPGACTHGKFGCEATQAITMRMTGAEGTLTNTERDVSVLFTKYEQLDKIVRRLEVRLAIIVAIITAAVQAGFHFL